MPRTRIARTLCSVIVLGAAPLAGQAPNEFDFDPGTGASSTLPPNGAVHTITGRVVLSGQHLLLSAPLLVASGAELRLDHCTLEVAGTVTMQEGCRVTVVDSALLLRGGAQPPGQPAYEFRMEGGVLQTERALIGSGYVNGNLAQVRLLSLRGTWLARQTVTQALITILADGRTGWYGNPLYRGGSVLADGLYEGDRTDAIHMSGMGDATLANGAMNVGLYFDAAGSAVASAATFDLDSRNHLQCVYGDPSVHQGVTAPIARSPYRLELRNHRVPTWQMFAVNATSTGPMQTITLQHAEDVICNFRGIDLVGAPVLGGPWASHYATLPGLPSTTRPGYHAMPPGCSVRLGNVVFQSGPGVADWNRIRAWGLYARGTGTNLTVVGPSHIAEINLTDGQMHLVGTGSFDMGVFANMVRLFQGASLDVQDASLGEFGSTSPVVGTVEANDHSTCTMTTVRTAPVTLRTTNAAAAILVQNAFGANRFTIDTAGGGSVVVQQAAPTQATDLQNLGFESSLLAGGTPPWWAASGVSGTLLAHAAGGGAWAYSASFANAGAWLGKQLTLPPETTVDLFARVDVPSGPAGASLLRAGDGSGANSTALPAASATWSIVQVPTRRASGLSPFFVQVLAPAGPAQAALDDVCVQIGSWWDDDNLANLDCEGECHYVGQAPDYLSAPDGFRSFQVQCEPAPGVVPPGSPGTRSLQMTLQKGTFGSISKRLTFLRAGDVLVLRGRCRSLSNNPGANLQVLVGDGPNFYQTNLGNNVQSGPLASNGTWHTFQLQYTVPQNPTYTRLDFGLYDAVGAVCNYDDMTVEIR